MVDKPQWLNEQMGTWREPFQKFEESRKGWVAGYEKWLQEKWPLGLAEHHQQQAHPGGEHPPDHPPAEPHQADGLPHTPHLLDFHSPRRPEFILFWSLMVICFFLGFLPKNREGPSGQPAK